MHDGPTDRPGTDRVGDRAGQRGPSVNRDSRRTIGPLLQRRHPVERDLEPGVGTGRISSDSALNHAHAVALPDLGERPVDWAVERIRPLEQVGVLPRVGGQIVEDHGDPLREAPFCQCPPRGAGRSQGTLARDRLARSRVRGGHGARSDGCRADPREPRADLGKPPRGRHRPHPAPFRDRLSHRHCGQGADGRRMVRVDRGSRELATARLRASRSRARHPRRDHRRRRPA